MTHENSAIEVSKTGSVARITLNRPDKFNPLSEEVLDALQSTLDEIGANPDIRVVVLAAKGRAFCAGHDLKQMRATTDKHYYLDLFQRCSQVMQTIMSIPQPVIARVQGMATAAGCQLVATCDLAVAAQSAQFAVSGINIGLFCSTPAVALSRNLSRKDAFEMLITGEFIDAESARDRGLVNRVVADDDLDDEVGKLCDTICAKLPIAVSTGKAMYYKQLQLGVEDAYALAGSAMAGNMMAPDTLEGVDAFIEKHKPDWPDAPE